MDPEPAPIHLLLERLIPYKIPLILGGVSLAAIVIAIGSFYQSATQKEPIVITSETSTSSGSMKSGIYVDISGAVVHPGVKVVPFNSRVIDVIDLAGGYSEDVDREKIEKTMNLAMKVKDGMKLYIPKKETITSHNTTDSQQTGSDTSHNLVSDEVGSMTVSINAASVTELVDLPGVGAVTAQKIISNRPYGDIQELVSKKVIGKALFEKLKSQLSL